MRVKIILPPPDSYQELWLVVALALEAIVIALVWKFWL